MNQPLHLHQNGKKNSVILSLESRNGWHPLCGGIIFKCAKLLSVAKLKPALTVRCNYRSADRVTDSLLLAR